MSDALDIASCSHPGRVRVRNEDAVFVDRRLGIVILADGMGGHHGGEVASGMAATLLGRELTQAVEARPLGTRSPVSGGSRAARLLSEKIAMTNVTIFGTARSQPQYAGMGTTLVVGVLYADRVTVAHVGDSRFYRLRASELARLTMDHSLAQLRVDSGLITVEEAQQSERASTITRALGTEPHVEPEIHEHHVEPGDAYLLCSDGLSDMVSDGEIAGILGSLAQKSLQTAAERLVHAGNEHGGRDNSEAARGGSTSAPLRDAGGHRRDRSADQSARSLRCCGGSSRSDPACGAVRDRRPSQGRPQGRATGCAL
jgi:protein phosphatase